MDGGGSGRGRSSEQDDSSATAGEKMNGSGDPRVIPVGRGLVEQKRSSPVEINGYTVPR